MAQYPNLFIICSATSVPKLVLSSQNAQLLCYVATLVSFHRAENISGCLKVQHRSVDGLQIQMAVISLVFNNIVARIGPS